jgi:hypothetical protein
MMENDIAYSKVTTLKQLHLPVMSKVGGNRTSFCATKNKDAESPNVGLRQYIKI